MFIYRLPPSSSASIWSSRFCFVSARLAVKRCNVAPIEGRSHLFPITHRTGADKKEYLAFVVKDAETRPSKQLKKMEQAAAGALPAAQHSTGT